MGISNILDAKLNKNEIISVFCNPEDNYKAVVGFVAGVDEHHFVLKHVTVDGKYDGYVLRCKDQIFRIDRETEYENARFTLYSFYGESHVDFHMEGSLLISFLKFAQENDFVVGIGVKDYEENSVFGLIDNIDLCNEVVSVHNINDEGHFDGFNEITFDSIVRMTADSEKGIRLKNLNRIAKNDSSIS